jgi:hypothetical protein
MVSDNTMPTQETRMDPVGAGTATPRSRAPTPPSMATCLVGGSSLRPCPMAGRGEPTAGPTVETLGNGCHNRDNHTLIYGQIGPIL